MRQLAIVALAALSATVFAKPIEVDLRANWQTPPFELAIIEAIAQENSTAYFPIVSAYIALSEQNGDNSDEYYRRQLVEHAIESGFVEKYQEKFIDLSLALHKPSALIQAYYQYYETKVAAEVEGKDCENVLEYNGKFTCDKDAVFALETSTRKDVELLPSDRVLGANPKAPIAVLYADIESPSFPLFHSHLVSSALNDKIQYIVRYKPGKQREKENLNGYAVELALKRTDYIVIDDRENATKVDDRVEISSNKLAKLGLRAGSYILGSEDKFQALVNASLDFPLHIDEILRAEADLELKKDVRANTDESLSAGQSALLINGAPVFSTHRDFFVLSDVLKREYSFIRELEKLGLNATAASDMVKANYVGKAEVKSRLQRYDYRTQGLIWLNDLEKDPQYKQLPSDIQAYLDPEYARQFAPVRHNTHSFVMALDLSLPRQREVLTQAWTLIQQKAPIQIGFIPLTYSLQGKAIAECLAYIDANHGRDKIEQFLINILQGSEVEEALKLTVGEKVDFAAFPEVEITVRNTIEWARRLDLPRTGGVAFANGFMISSSPAWLNEAAPLFQEDIEEVQRIVREENPSKDTPIRDLLLSGAIKKRSSVVTPADRTSIKYIRTAPLSQLEVPTFETTGGPGDLFGSFYIIGDFADEEPLQQLIHLSEYSKSRNGLRVSVVPVIDGQKKNTGTRASRRGSVVAAIQAALIEGRPASLQKGLNSLKEFHFGDKALAIESLTEKTRAKLNWNADFEPTVDINSGLSEQITESIDHIALGTQLIFGGRVLEATHSLDADDLHNLWLAEEERIESIIGGAAERGLHLKSAVEADNFVSQYTKTYHMDGGSDFFISRASPRLSFELHSNSSSFELGPADAPLQVTAVVNPLDDAGQEVVAHLKALKDFGDVNINVVLNPVLALDKLPLKRMYHGSYPVRPSFNQGKRTNDIVEFTNLGDSTLYNLEIHIPSAWLVDPEISEYDLENIVLANVKEDTLSATYELRSILLEGHSRDASRGTQPPRGLQLEIGTKKSPLVSDTIVMANLGYFQFQANPGYWTLNVKEGRSSEVFEMISAGLNGYGNDISTSNNVWMTSMTGTTIFPRFKRKKGQEHADVLNAEQKSLFSWGKKAKKTETKQADVNIFTVASGHLYERFLSIMTASVMRHSNHTVKFWLIEQFLSPKFKEFLPHLAEKYGFEYELITYKWPHWLRGQTEKQRTIWGYKILFLDVLFPQSLEKVIFVDADQIVRTDLKELVDIDLEGAPYGYTPMCDSREEIEGFRFWKQGYWKTFLADKFRYHISALYVVDLNRFRQLAAGDRIRQHYQQLSADPNSLANLDQDLPNNLQPEIPIFSLSQDWLWCETWCSDESLTTAKTIDLCNNPMTKEPKLDRAKRQVPEWIEYDNAITALSEEFDNLRATSLDDEQFDNSDEQEEEDDEFLHHDDL